MKKEKVYELTTKEAKNLADVISIIQDLQYADKCLSKLLDIIESKDKEVSFLEKPLWEAGLIAYARCFASGKRFGLQKEIYRYLEGDPIGAHNYYINLRNKHIAHSVNPFEQVKIGIFRDSEEKEAWGIAHLSMLLSHSSKEGIETLKNLACFGIQKMFEKKEVIENEILRDLKNYSNDKLYELKTIKIVVPGPTDTGVSR